MHKPKYIFPMQQSWQQPDEPHWICVRKLHRHTVHCILHSPHSSSVCTWIYWFIGHWHFLLRTDFSLLLCCLCINHFAVAYFAHWHWDHVFATNGSGSLYICLHHMRPSIHIERCILATCVIYVRLSRQRCLYGTATIFGHVCANEEWIELWYL